MILFSILFEVQWKNGMEILKKEGERCKKEKDLLQLQEELFSLIEREKEIFSWISTYIPSEEDSGDKELESDLGNGSYEGDLMTTEYFPLSSLKTDYLVCPISSSLTSIDSNLKEAKIKGETNACLLEILQHLISIAFLQVYMYIIH